MFRHSGHLFLVVFLAFVLGQPARGEAPGQEGKKDAPASAKVRTDRHGDPLPPGAVARLGTLRYRLQGEPSLRGFTPDGKALLCLAEDGSLRLLDVHSGTTTHPKTSLGQEANAYGTHRKYQEVVLAGDCRTMGLDVPEGLVLADVLSGKQRGNISREMLMAWANNEMTNIASSVFSHDGRLLAVVRYETAAGQEGELKRTLLAWFDTSQGKLLHYVRIRKGVFSGQTSFTRDGRTLAAVEHHEGAGNASLRMWDVVSGKELRTVKLPEDVGAFEFLPDGKALILLGAAGGSVRLLEAATGKELLRFPEKAGEAHAFTLAPDGAWLCVLGPRRARFFDAATGRELGLLRHPSLGTDATTAFVSPDGRLLAAAGKHHLMVWEVATRRAVHPMHGHLAPVGALAFAPGGRRLVATAQDATVLVWDLPGGREDRRFTPVAPPADNDQQNDPSSPVGAGAAFSLDGKTLMAAWSGRTVQLWDAETSRPLRQLGAMPDPRPVALSPDGGLLAAGGSDGLVRLWRTDSGGEMRRFEWHPPLKEEGEVAGGLTSVSFSPNSKALAVVGLLSVGESLRVQARLWEVSTGNERLRLDFLPTLAILTNRRTRTNFSQLAETLAAAFSPDGSLLAVSDGSTIGLWDTASGRELRHFGGARVNARTVAFSPNGRLLAAGKHDGSIRLWSPDNGAVLGDVPGHGQAVTALAFSPDGKLLASGSEDTTVLLWDVAQLLRGLAERNSGPVADKLQAQWDDLASADAARANRAIGALAALPEAVPFLKARLRPAEPVDPRRLEKLLAALGSAQYAAREQATRELERLGDLAGQALRKLLAGQPALETRRRIEALLHKLDGPVTAPEVLRGLRAIEALERVGSAGARDLLRALAAGAPGHRITAEARAALDRLAKRPPAGP
jgi:WD40 repeat protein